MKKLLYISLFFINVAMGMDNNNIRFASNDNDFRNDALLVSKQAETPYPIDKLKKMAMDYFVAQRKIVAHEKLTEQDMQMLDMMFDQISQCYKKKKDLNEKEKAVACLTPYDKEVVDFIIAVYEVFNTCFPIQEKGKLEPYIACLQKHANNKTPEVSQFVKYGIKKFLQKEKK
ncbi:hypothetical protein [Helicobacter pylori]|uniref:hypothetical protein n=1 Tax=Helicobacter pylori TaxID=210 RepID=UPI00165A4F84|nr:hypothetical protein [Helicobacter pylori]